MKSRFIGLFPLSPPRHPNRFFLVPSNLVTLGCKMVAGCSPLVLLPASPGVKTARLPPGRNRPVTGRSPRLGTDRLKTCYALQRGDDRAASSIDLQPLRPKVPYPPILIPRGRNADRKGHDGQPVCSSSNFRSIGFQSEGYRDDTFALRSVTQGSGRFLWLAGVVATVRRHP